MDNLCRAEDAIISSDKIIVPSNITSIVLEDKKVLKCEAYPVTINDIDSMVVDLVINSKYRNKFNEIITRVHIQILQKLGAEYLPHGYKNNESFGTNRYTAKLDREALRLNKKGYINPINFEEIQIDDEYDKVHKLIKTY